jgi:hypothetical protein
MSNGDILISTAASFSVKPTYIGPGQGTGSPNVTGFGEDILRFRPTGADATGRITAGSYRNFLGTSTGLYFDGSTKGLSGTSENIDAVSVLADGRILISTTGAVTVPGLANRQAWDVLAYQPANNTWSVYFSGANVGLSGTAENIDGLALSDPSASLPTLYFSTSGNFSVNGASGDKKDIFRFVPTSLGNNTAGDFGPGLTLDGSQTGMPSGMDITGMFLGIAPGAFPLHAAGTATPPATAAGNLRWVETDGVVNIWIDTNNGLFDSAEVARIQDAIAALSTASQQAGGPRVVEVTNANQADVRVSSQPGSLLGGVANGVLGTTQVSYSVTPSGALANGETFHQIQGHEFGVLSQVVLIDGWNWYTGSDPAGIGAGQYDLQSVAAHELGHALGLLDNSTSSDAVMFETLPAGTTRRTYGRADLASLDSLYAAGFELNSASGTAAAAVTAPTLQLDPSLDPEVFKLLNRLRASSSQTTPAASKGAAPKPKGGLVLGATDRQAADELFAVGGGRKSGKSLDLGTAEEWWNGLSV